MKNFQEEAEIIENHEIDIYNKERSQFKHLDQPTSSFATHEMTSHLI